MTPSSALERLGGMNNYDGLTGFSYSAWVNLTDQSAGFNGLVSQDFGSCCINRMMVDSTLHPYVDAGQHQDVQFNGTAPGYGQWFFLVFTTQVSGGNTSMVAYINGVATSDSPLVEPIALPSLAGVNTYIGVGEAATTWFMNGALADVRIYDGTLTSQEVSALFSAGAGAGAGTPEPGTAMLLATGCAAAILLRRRHAR